MTTAVFGLISVFFIKVLTVFPSNSWVEILVFLYCASYFNWISHGSKTNNLMFLVLLKQYRDELSDCFVWTLISFANRLLFIIVHLIQWLQIRDRNKVRTVPVTGQEKTGDKENSMLPSEIFHMSMSKCTNVGWYFFITFSSIRA